MTTHGRPVPATDGALVPHQLGPGPGAAGTRSPARLRPRETAATRARQAALAGEFVLNRTRPEMTLAAMRISDADICLWRCSANPLHPQWEAKFLLRARSADPNTCPECGWERRHAAKPGTSLADGFPHVAEQFVANLSHPTRTPDLLTPGSDSNCLWRCARGHTWKSVVHRRTSRRGSCLECAVHGISRFEEEVAALLEASTSLPVRTSASVDVPGVHPVDLHIPALGLYLDLDPVFTHKDALQRDTDKARAMKGAGLDFVRVREHGLPDIAYPCVTVSGRFGARAWASQLAGLLTERGAVWSEPCDERAAEVLGAVHRAWSERAGRPEVTALDKAPHLAGEFVQNLTHRGVGLDRLSPGSEDMIRWSCTQCPHEWNAAVNDRASAGYGCNKCATRRAAVKRSTPGPGESLAETHPAVAAEFVRCLSRPGATPATLRAGANERCEFRCSAPGCGHVWPTHLPNRTRPAINSGCPQCGRRRSEAAKIGRGHNGRTLRSECPELAAEFDGCTDGSDRTADQIAPTTSLDCRWRCGKCGHIWEDQPKNRVKNYRRAGSACPSCRNRVRKSPR